MKKLIIFNFALLFIIGLMTVTTHCSTKRHWSKRERYAQKNLPSRRHTESDKKLETKNQFGYTPLTHAVLQNDLKKVRKLLKEGANPENILVGAYYNTDKPVMLAELLRYGAKVTAKDSDRSTPLHQAVGSFKPHEYFEQLL